MDELAPLKSPNDPAEDARRVRNILLRARRSVAFKDLVTLSLVRVWSALVPLGVLLAGLFSARRPPSRGSRGVDSP